LILAGVIAEVPALAQTGAPPATHGAGGTAPAGGGSEIRHVDFRNFTFRKPGEAAGIQLRNGKLATKDEDYRISRIIYGDLNADGHEAAVVMIGIENKLAANPQNADLEDDYVYLMRNGKPTLVAMVAQSQIYRDVKGSLNDPDQMCNEMLGNPVIRSIAIGVVVVDATGGGRFCSPPDKYHVVLRYRWDGTRFVLERNPWVRLSKN
jgi:hypothetical protein